MSGMYFLIDYENVKENGLSGFEHLTSNDDVLIFFSESTSKIKQGVWKKLCDTGCSIEICKLAKVRKNGPAAVFLFFALFLTAIWHLT